MASNGKPALKELNYDLLDELRRFWFEHIKDDDQMVVPDMAVMKPFFIGGEDFDRACVKFTPALDELRSQNVTSTSTLLELLPPRGPLDWLALQLLLDQVPRNCYRGEASSVVFNFFDPLSLGLAQAAIRDRIYQSPELRWNFTYRFWLVLPLIHSESLDVHNRIEADVLGPMITDIDSLINGSSDADDGSAERSRAKIVLQQRPEAGKFLTKGQADQAEKHTVILRRFGRYPHRNGPMGRDMRPEEQKYLDEGGDTFAPPKNDEERAKWDAAREEERRRAVEA
ncbi:SpoVR like family protein [Sarocladium implicatum]|nr:SpoVR like family protein [Sarocladium implicatum]